MKRFVVVLALLLLVIPLVTSQAADHSVRELTVTSPANCQAQAKQSLNQGIKVVVVTVRCKAKEASGTKHTILTLEPMDAPRGTALMVHVPRNYTFSTSDIDQAGIKETHVIVRHLDDSEQLPEPAKDNMSWSRIGWFLVKCTVGKCDIHP